MASEKTGFILAPEGATLSDVAQVTFLRNAGEREKHAEVSAEYFREGQPASTLFGTDFIYKEMPVEISAIVVIQYCYLASGPRLACSTTSHLISKKQKGDRPVAS